MASPRGREERKTTSVLISGAGIAGPSLAFWLTANGYRVTIVELAHGIRPGGQTVDLRGPAAMSSR
jgi:2-polyprenyl-6-methoxyphenol hydroxylase-like FAD-dependent oxidoreductase